MVVFVYTRGREVQGFLWFLYPPLFFVKCYPKDDTDEFNLSKTDLNVFLLPSAVCSHQHRLQEPEERGT